MITTAHLAAAAILRKMCEVYALNQFFVLPHRRKNRRGRDGRGSSAEDTKLERRVAALSGVAEARRIQATSFQITAHIIQSLGGY